MSQPKLRIMIVGLIVAGLALAAYSLADVLPNDPSPAAAEAAAEGPTPAATATATTPAPLPTLTEVRPPPPPTSTSTRVVGEVTPIVVTNPDSTATLPPTDTPVAATAGEARLYTVEQYDTLWGIAVQFGTTIEAIVLANNISENDFLQIGQELVIPAEGQSLPTAPPAAEFENLVEQPVDSQAAAAPPEVALAAPPAPTPYPLPGGPPPVFAVGANINPLTGLPVDDPAKLRRRPLMVRIGNDPAARLAQRGLNAADIVYEEITEWWLTRFTAIFLGDTPATVGPIRSVRLVNVQLVPQYQGALAHSGGSDAVRWEISQAPLVDLDEFYNPAPYFYRENEGWQTRLSLDTQAARDYMLAQGLEAAVSLPPFLFSDAPPAGEPGQHIYIPYPQATSFTEWHYDATIGKYLRWIDGSPLNDVLSGQVGADNVVIYFAEHQRTDIVEDATGATSVRIVMNGVGSAWFFRDGLLTRGSWQTDGTRPPYFTTASGDPYALKPGNTWVEIVPTYYTIGLNSADEASARP